MVQSLAAVHDSSVTPKHNLHHLKEEFVSKLSLWFSWLFHELISPFINFICHNTILRIPWLHFSFQYLFKLFKCLYVPKCEWILWLHCVFHITNSSDEKILLCSTWISPCLCDRVTETGKMIFALFLVHIRSKHWSYDLGRFDLTSYNQTKWSEDTRFLKSSKFTWWVILCIY